MRALVSCLCGALLAACGGSANNGAGPPADFAAATSSDAPADAAADSDLSSVHDGSAPDGGAAPIWSEEFETLDLLTATHNGKWYANADSPNAALTTGGKDPAGTTWNANPNQNFGGSVGVLNPFSVGVVVDAKGSPSDGNAVTISCNKATSAQKAAIAGVNQGTSVERWGGTICQNADFKYFSVGSYIEIRALFTGSGQGVWPAIWFFSPQGLNSGEINPAPFQGAELDLVEPQGRITPGYVSIHMREVGDAPNPNYQVNGSSDIDCLYGYPVTENEWATYGFDWQKNALTFYLNGTEVARVTDPTVLSYYNQAKMAFRLDYTMLPGTDGATDPVKVSVDYIREWPSFAARSAH
jgi:hypothetical protein